MSFTLANLQEHNSELLKLLTNNLPDMLWVKDRDGKYIYANKAICDGLLMAKDIDEPIGKGDVFFALREREKHKNEKDWHTFGELCFDSDDVVIKNNKAMRFEEYGNVKGKQLYLEVYKAPFYDKDGYILGTVGTGRDITEFKRIQLDLEKSLKVLDTKKEELQYQGSHDSLTNLPNRKLFTTTLQHALVQAKKKREKLVILFIDLDNFKEINDSLGHVVGDKVLIEVKKRIEKVIGNAKCFARFGGDEFAIILDKVGAKEETIAYIETLIATLHEALLIGNNILYSSISIGVSVFPSDGDNVDTLLQNADSAMYEAKDAGKNRYSFYDKEMTEKAFKRVFLETALRQALKEDELVVYFQPQIDAQDDTLVGMETLVRWNHPTLGLIPPNEFIPLAEATGMIVELDRVVMKKALSQFKKWHDDGLIPGKLAMNLAMKQIESEDFLDFFKELLGNNECLYNNVELEVTESQIMKNPDKSICILQDIHDLGISISIDDFGTGYSSLAYLKKLPISKLKIDKSFVDNVPNDAEDAAICKTIINLCKSLHLNVIAEGIETEAQKEFMLENGCRLIQGYLYSRPLSIGDMTEYLEKRKLT